MRHEIINSSSHKEAPQIVANAVSSELQRVAKQMAEIEDALAGLGSDSVDRSMRLTLQSIDECRQVCEDLARLSNALAVAMADGADTDSLHPSINVAVLRLLSLRYRLFPTQDVASIPKSNSDDVDLF